MSMTLIIALPQSAVYNYYYDPFGRRLWKEVNGNRTYYFYSDEGLIGEYDATGAEIKTYGYKPDSTWTTDPVFMKQGAEYYFYHNDHLGTPMIMTDISGNIVWSATYDSFGKSDVQPSSTITNNLRFSGQYYDAETGLHYNWNRYYDPTIGRYITIDPIGFLGGDVNLYAYVGGNPVNRVDPFGQNPLTFVWDFIWGIINAASPVPTGMINPDAVDATIKICERNQRDYDHWCKTFGECGPENPYYYNMGVNTQDGSTYTDRLNDLK